MRYVGRAGYTQRSGHSKQEASITHLATWIKEWCDLHKINYSNYI